jgi:8-oxo-dGTP pyrophosphatase MutT (NUDIX family)
MCAIRETKEEIGLFVPDLKLVGIYHSPSKGMHSDSLKFIFSGGTLSDEQISNINLQKEECDEYSFMDPSTAISLLSNSLKNSVPLCLEAIKKNTVAYIDA